MEVIKQKITQLYKKPLNILVALLLVFGTTAPLLDVGSTSALQVSSRSITMSTSVPGVSANYAVSFTPKSSANVGGIVIAFCDNDPIIGDTCSTSAGSVVATGVTITGQSGDISGFTLDGASTATTVIISDATPTAESSSNPITFNIDGITNPNYLSCTPQSPNCSFFARIETFDTAADAEAFNPTATVGVGLVDSGGIALSTNQQITVTSKVQEVLVFCVFTAGSCAAGGNGIDLGNNNGVLSSSNSYVNDNTQYTIQTNASAGADIVAQSPNSLKDGSGDLIQYGTNLQSAMGATPTTAYLSTPGSPQFGFCDFEDVGSTGLTPTAPYNSPTGSACSTTTTGASGDNGATFAFNIGDLSAAGDQIASTVAGPTKTGTVAFIGNISNTNIAGIYTTTLTLIATGTY